MKCFSTCLCWVYGSMFGLRMHILVDMYSLRIIAASHDHETNFSSGHPVTDFITGPIQPERPLLSTNPGLSPVSSLVPDAMPSSDGAKANTRTNSSKTPTASVQVTQGWSGRCT